MLMGAERRRKAKAPTACMNRHGSRQATGNMVEEERKKNGAVATQKKRKEAERNM